MSLRPHFLRPSLLCTFALALPAGASAAVSDMVLRVTVRSANQEATADVPITAALYEAESNWVDWTLGGSRPLELGSVGATILDASVTVSAGSEPNVDFSFSILAGDEDIVCEVRTLWLGFLPPDAGAASGRATASISVTDLDGNGASLIGLGPPGSGVFRATLDNGGRLFSQLISQVMVGPNGTASGSQNDPIVGYRMISGTFEQMDSRLAFRLSRNDLASATTTFELRNVPDFQLFSDADMNCDAQLTVSDIAGFISALFDPSQYDEDYPACSAQLADVDGNGVVTVSDIAAFVQELASAAAPAPTSGR